MSVKYLGGNGRFGRSTKKASRKKSLEKAGGRIKVSFQQMRKDREISRVIDEEIREVLSLAGW